MARPLVVALLACSLLLQGCKNTPPDSAPAPETSDAAARATLRRFSCNEDDWKNPRNLVQEMWSTTALITFGTATAATYVLGLVAHGNTYK